MNCTRTVLALSLALLTSSCSTPHPPEPANLWKVAEDLQNRQWVDLTHAFDSKIPHWKGFKPMTAKVLYDHEKHGFRVEEFCHVGQWGTHIDPPVHFHAGLRTLESIDIKEMLLPFVVIDTHEAVEKNPDYVISMDDIRSWESRHGLIPAKSFVAMRTDWSSRWPDQKKIQNLDAKGVAHYPGWSSEVLKYLFEGRKVTAAGHETTDTDPGVATSKDDYSLESYILKQDKYQIELLANLNKVPESGSLVFVSWAKPKDGSGFPARVIAILP